MQWEPLALAAALALATSTPLTEASRKTQRALYLNTSKILAYVCLGLSADEADFAVVTGPALLLEVLD